MVTYSTHGIPIASTLPLRLIFPTVVAKDEASPLLSHLLGLALLVGEVWTGVCLQGDRRRRVGEKREERGDLGNIHHPLHLEYCSCHSRAHMVRVRSQYVWRVTLNGWCTR